MDDVMMIDHSIGSNGEAHAPSVERRITQLHHVVATLAKRLEESQNEAQSVTETVRHAMAEFERRSSQTEQLVRELIESQRQAGTPAAGKDPGPVQLQLEELIRRQDALAQSTQQIGDLLRSAVRRPNPATANPATANPAAANPGTASRGPAPADASRAARPVSGAPPAHATRAGAGGNAPVHADASRAAIVPANAAPAREPHSATTPDAIPGTGAPAAEESLIGRMEHALQRISVAVRSRSSEPGQTGLPERAP